MAKFAGMKDIFIVTRGEKMMSLSADLHEVPSGIMYCTQCGKANRDDSHFCGYCGNPFSNSLVVGTDTINKEELDLSYYKANLEMQHKQLLLQQQAIELQKKELEETRLIVEKQEREYDLQKRHFNQMKKCPRCGSTSLTGNKKGYGIGKGLIGAAVFGPIGLVAGNIGSRKVIVTCMKCGYRFKK